jgi:outer membrane receptor for ferrienterochelin and colicin
MLRRFTHAMLAVALTACASAGSSSGTPKDSSVITREEIATSMESNAYDAVAKLRPLFLRSRGRTTINGEVNDYATVFVDGVRYGDLSTMRGIVTNQVQMIRFLGGPDAVTKYGMQYGSGAIEVFTR